ncbi:MAG: hypothetical protein NT062_05680 [Proteobacteria bacterium]|nr:hypothetical protein [Pseudomonadota bacterium]
MILAQAANAPSVEQRAAPLVGDTLPDPTCPDGDAVVRVEGGTERGKVCAASAAELGLTVVDLQDAWTPSMFAPTGALTPNIRATYLTLAARDDADALAELYGVVPSLAIVRARLADDARHACHAAIDGAPIARLARSWSQDDAATTQAGEATRVWLGKALEQERVKRKLADLAALAEVSAVAPRYARWKALDDRHAGLVAAQQHFGCEHTLDAKYADGTITWRTGNATELFQRRNFLMPNERLDEETRDALQIDSRELDYRLALRILRERVVDAAGLIEDGTAGAGPQPVMGRLLDPAAMRAARGHEAPLPNGAPDLVSAATDVAATQLGWRDPVAVRAFLDRHPGGTRVALALPPVPAYHAAHMELSAVIDRGDVYYDERPIPRRVAHRPTIVVSVDDHGIKRPLVRWPTTIGGWSDQRTTDGDTVQRWKESDVGPRVWRDLYAGPTWLPPKTTPDKDLVKNLYNGHWALKKELLGPGPHAAFGMSLLVHHQVFQQKDGTERFDDNGIGTHGSASVTSIVNGTSHGCHRLYNQLAVRLSDFLLRHRDHVVKGEQPERYVRAVNYKESFVAKVDTRGFLYELTPPVPVVVTRGNVLSPRKAPPKGAVYKPTP